MGCAKSILGDLRKGRPSECLSRTASEGRMRGEKSEGKRTGSVSALESRDWAEWLRDMGCE